MFYDYCSRVLALVSQMIDINTPQSAIVVCEEKSPFPEYRPVKVSSLENLWVSLMELRKDNWTKPEMLRVWIKLDTECAAHSIARPADTAPLSDVIPSER